MSKKREIITELLERRTRNLKRTPRLEQTRRRLLGLEESFQTLYLNTHISPRAKQELLRYFPIGLIAITEGHFKNLYRDLIDSGEPFSSNAINFKEIKADIASLLATSRRTISVGEFIASQLSHSNLGQVEDNLSILLGQDFHAEFTKRLSAKMVSVGTRFFKLECGNSLWRHFASDIFFVTSLLHWSGQRPGGC